MGIIKIEVNPCYSSFIGNMIYDYIDPINASIEIGRRGIFKYKKDSFYPKLTSTILNTMKTKFSRDVLDIKDGDNWMNIYQEVKKSGLRYRATLNDCNKTFSVVNNIIHSNIKKYIIKL
jgi:hypothetical protein